MYGMSEIVESTADTTIEEVLQDFVNVLPPSWQYPDVTCACIVLDEREYTTSNYRLSPWQQSADLVVHGEDAERAARATVAYVGARPSAPLTALFAGCNEAIRKTRGVAMGIVVIDEEAGTLTHTGVGNTRAVVVEDKTTHLGSTAGIVGAGYGRLAPEAVPFMADDLGVMVTDGIKQRFDFADFAEMGGTDVQRLAEKILQDWGKETAAAAVLVFKKTVK